MLYASAFVNVLLHLEEVQMFKRPYFFFFLLLQTDKLCFGTSIDNTEVFSFSGIIKKCPFYLHKMWLSQRAYFVYFLSTWSQHTHHSDFLEFLHSFFCQITSQSLSKLFVKHTSFRELSGQTPPTTVTLEIFLLGFTFIF